MDSENNQVTASLGKYTMTLIPWITNINDDYLVQWANKGLLRRGKKQLEKLIAADGLSDWQLDDSVAGATIDGFEQQLTAVGFDHLSCSCAATGPCFHLICFLLGLQTLAVNRPEGTDSNADSRADTDANISPAVGEAISESDLPPWHISEAGERERQLGKAHVTKAQRQVLQGVPVDWQETGSALTGSIELNRTFNVHIPRAGGLAVSLCSCKKEKCEHRALLVLTWCIAQGLMAPPEDKSALDPWQGQVLEQVEQWLNQLAQQGMSSVTRLLLDQGDRLITELKQADLPKPAYLVERINGLLRLEWQRQLISSPDRLRTALAELYAHLLALRTEPMPQPLRILAGEHKRRFNPVRQLDLIGIGAEEWSVSTDASSSSGVNSSESDKLRTRVYFYSPSQQRFYTVSYQGNRGQNIESAYLGNCAVNRLLHSRFTLAQGWSSADGGISTRQGTHITEVSPLTVQAVLEQSVSVNAQINAIAEQMIHNPYDKTPSRLGIVRCESMTALTFANTLQQWRSECTDLDGNRVIVAIDATTENEMAINRWQQYCQDATAIFGRWHYQYQGQQYQGQQYQGQSQKLTFFPIALYGCDWVQFLRLDYAYSEKNCSKVKHV